MRGISFFRELARGAGGDGWPHRAAAMCTARAAELRLERQLAAARDACGYARHRIARVTDIPFRKQLFALADAIDQPYASDAHLQQSLGTKLHRLGNDLRERGQYDGALEVFRIMGEGLTDDPELRLLSMQGKAWVCRRLKRFEDAQWAYEYMEWLAKKVRNTPLRLEARLGVAKIHIERDGEGDLREAVRIITALLTTARRNTTRHRTLLAKALVDRSAVAGMLNDPVSAIVDANEALAYIDDQDLRDHTMLNLGTALREVGHAVAARDLALYLWHHAIEVEQRVLGGVLRYNLAIDAADERAIERVSHGLAAIPMTPTAAAEYAEAQARDHATRHHFAEAAVAAARMHALAIEHGMQEMVFRAARALADIERGIVPALYTFRPVHVTTAAEQTLAAVDHAVARLCAI